MDAVAVESVIAAEAACSDRARAEAALAAALVAARAPRRGAGGAWLLRVSVANVAPGIKLADAQIRDDDGHVVAERAVNDKTSGSCTALVRAVGAWAQMILDDELARATDAPPVAAPEPLPLAPAVERPVDADAPTAGVAAPSLPRTKRTIEVGSMVFLRNGLSRGGTFGVAPFASIGFGESWILRPAAAVGTSFALEPDDRSPPTTALGGRLDVCRRVPGNYIDHRGLELDLCAGSDVNYTSSRQLEALRSSLGPSAVMRGGIGDFGLELRTMAGVNLTPGPELQPFVLVCEVGASMRIQ